MVLISNFLCFFFFKQKTAYEMLRSLVGSEMCIRDSFEKALDLVLEACVQNEVPPEEVGELSLVVLSDMQFDAARNAQHYYGYGNHSQSETRNTAWQTQYEQLVSKFEKAGARSKWKQPYPVPRVIFWNLRGDTHDFAATAQTPGVDMVAGFSPNMLKLFMEGNLEDLLASITIDDKPSSKPAQDPYQTLRKCLDDDRYQPVREACARVAEGILANYVPPVLMATSEENDESDGFVVVEASDTNE
eukprot:TRINITY_DN37120_c0_g1_i2.p1 TRINITY_DN37120_c0_g1~~TRINITY_DN37120_c0_g1_i2.p1  ORF type:complete len:245 (+),score=65.34 TRINITY_DN37120_c0_g1_i2:47-781(+)